METILSMKSAQPTERNGANGRATRVPPVRNKRKTPVESMAAPAWCLPGGVRLAEYVLQSGFVASSLLARIERDR